MNASPRQPPPENRSAPASVWAWLRLVAACAITLVALPYLWGRTLVLGMLERKLRFDDIGKLVVAIALVALLTRGLSRRFASLPFDRRLNRLLIGLWLAITGGLIAAFAGDTMSRLPVVTLVVPATLWVLWLAWMFYPPWGWKKRFGVLAALVALAFPFPLLLRVAGLTGNARINFAWRDAAPHSPAQLPAGAVSASDSTAAADLTSVGPNDYPQYLGPDRTGVVRDIRLSADWATRPPRELWRKAVGEGWGSFAVVGDFACTQEQHGASEAVRCLRVADGETMWVLEYPARFGVESGGSNLGGTGPRATPTIAAGRVYAIGATGKLHCLDGRTGNPLWAADVLADNDGAPISHGVCASPLLVDGLVVVCPTGNDAACLAAYDQSSGRCVWRAGRHKASYGSPALVDLAGHRQLLVATAEGLASHAASSGGSLWHFPWANNVTTNCSQPLVIDGPAGRIFFSTGYGTGAVLLQVAPGDAGWNVTELWKAPNEMKTKFTTPVRLRDGIYGLDDGILACLDLSTGKRRWKGGRYQHGQILLAGELLIVQAENGDLALVRPDPGRFVELARIPALDGKTWNNPALDGRRLLVRNDHEAACYELPLQED
ncbi:MAG: outer membrane protein assembly factor BamB family protein [Planctomycetaceae bacterium]